MPSLPRIITVDPTGTVARVVRATIDLTEYACRQIDVPSGEEALEEMQIGGCNLMVAALNLEDMRAFDLATQAREIKPEIAIAILADEDDPPMDMNGQREHGFVYLQRPLDIHKFSSVMFAGMRGSDLFDALSQPSHTTQAESSMGPVPQMEISRAKSIISNLVTDLGAMSILLIARDGTILLEMGTTNFVESEALLHAVTASMLANIDMRDIVGGDATMLQFYDGDDRDIYTLSVGLHHMLCIAYDGEKGQRQFGMVNSLGRRAALDLIALVGAEAFFIHRREPQPEEDDIPRKKMTRVMNAVEVDNIELERAEEFSAPAGNELEKIELEAIPDDMFDASFLDQLDAMDENAAEDLFSLDNLAGVSNSLKSTRTISDEEARQLGILGND